MPPTTPFCVRFRHPSREGRLARHPRKCPENTELRAILAILPSLARRTCPFQFPLPIGPCGAYRAAHATVCRNHILSAHSDKKRIASMVATIVVLLGVLLHAARFVCYGR